MNFRSITINRAGWSSIWITLILFFVVGCKVEDTTWIDKMLAEMESAWGEADNTGRGHEGRKSAVTAVAKSYFRPGMPKQEAFNLLKELELQGFDIGEYRHDGARDWPNGELKPYTDHATKISLQRQIPQGVSRITATKEYGRVRLIITKHVGITLVVNDRDPGIADVEASVWTNSI